MNKYDNGLMELRELTFKQLQFKEDVKNCVSLEEFNDLKNKLDDYVPMEKFRDLYSDLNDCVKKATLNELQNEV